MPYYMQDLHPDCSAAIQLIQHLDKDELRELLNNDERLNGMVKDLQQVRNTEAEREMLLASNKSLAEYNLSREPNLQQSRQHLIALYQQATTLKNEVEAKKYKVDEESRQTSLDTTLALLQTEAAQTEEETESLAENFLDGKLTVETFLEEFLEKRKLMHLRRVKIEKMSELLRSSQPLNASTVPVPVRPAPLPPVQPGMVPGYPGYGLPMNPYGIAGQVGSYQPYNVANPVWK